MPGLYERLVKAYGAVDPTLASLGFAPGVYWVMDLGWYKRIRAEFRLPADDADPGEWEPSEADMLMGVPIRVREDGGEPHIEKLTEERAYASIA